MFFNKNEILKSHALSILFPKSYKTYNKCKTLRKKFDYSDCDIDCILLIVSSNL